VKEDLEEQLFKNHPVLFADKEIPIEVGDGWFTLIDKLLDMMDSKFDRAVKDLEECTDEKMIGTYRALMLSEKEKLPSILQIKEKFGTLRFYCLGVTEEMRAQIDFAEHLSSTICEICGAVGEVSRGGGWHQCMCSRCRNELVSVKVSTTKRELI